MGGVRQNAQRRARKRGEAFWTHEERPKIKTKMKIINFKFIGAILLIVGTSIGGGILALPVAAASGGFFSATLFLLLCWLLMTIGAFYVLEVTLCLPDGNNLITMTKRTLGRRWASVAWVSYLLLLYSLISAYLSASSDVIGALVNLIHHGLSHHYYVVATTLLIAVIVYCGIHSVDRVNRLIMFLKLLAFFTLVVLLMAHVDGSQLWQGAPLTLFPVITVMITSFGYAIIVPSLRTYFHNDVAILRKVVIVGSFIPLICYILWMLAVFGIVPAEGKHGLIAMAHSSHSTSELMQAISMRQLASLVSPAIKLFTSLSVFTSFLGVSLCLYDFFADGLGLKPSGQSAFLLLTVTFFPPLLIVLFFPGIFIYGLSFAGITCAVLLMLLPAMMVWSARFGCKALQPRYQFMGGKPLIIFEIVAAVVIMAIGIWFDVIKHCLPA